MMHVLKMFLMIFIGSYRQNLREVVNTMTALDQLKTSVMNDKENQEKYIEIMAQIFENYFLKNL